MSITIPYPGGKGRLSRTIVSFLPKRGRTFVDAFAGKGNIFWQAVSQGLKYREWWLNDTATSRFFHAIKHAGHKLKVPTRSRTEYERQREASISGDLTAILLEPYLSFSGDGYFAAGCKGGTGRDKNYGAVPHLQHEPCHLDRDIHRGVRYCRVWYRTQTCVTLRQQVKCDAQTAFLWPTVFFLMDFFTARFLVGAFTTNPVHVAAPMRFMSLRRWLSSINGSS